MANDPDTLKNTLKGSAVPSSRGTRPTDCFTASHKFYSSREAVRPTEATASKLLSLRLAPQTQRWTRAFGSPVSEGDDGASAPLRAVRRQAQGNADQDTRELR